MLGQAGLRIEPDAAYRVTPSQDWLLYDEHQQDSHQNTGDQCDQERRVSVETGAIYCIDNRLVDYSIRPFSFGTGLGCLFRCISYLRKSLNIWASLH